MAEGGFEEIPMEERGHGNDGYDDTDESTPLIAGGRRGNGSTEGRRLPGIDEGIPSSFPDQRSQMEMREQYQEEARKRIQLRYPDWDPRESPFVATMSRGKVVVSLIDGGKISSSSYILFKNNGELRSGLSDKIVDGLGRSIHGIANELYVSVIEKDVEEKEAKIAELSVELKKTKEKINELNSKLGFEYLERKEEKEDLVDEIKESKEKISILESEKKRMNKEKDEALRQAREDYEKRIEYAVTLKMQEMGASKEDNVDQVRKINEKYEKEISEKNEKISDLEKRLDISNEEKKELDCCYKGRSRTIEQPKKRRTKTSRGGLRSEGRKTQGRQRDPWQ